MWESDLSGRASHCDSPATHTQPICFAAMGPAVWPCHGGKPVPARSQGSRSSGAISFGHVGVASDKAYPSPCPPHRAEGKRREFRAVQGEEWRESGGHTRRVKTGPHPPPHSRMAMQGSGPIHAGVPTKPTGLPRLAQDKGGAAHRTTGLPGRQWGGHML